MRLRVVGPSIALMTLVAGCATPAPAPPAASRVPTPLAAPTATTAAPSPTVTVIPSPTAAPSPSAVATPTTTPTARPRPSLEAAVQAAVGNHQGSIGVVVRNLRTGEDFSVNADRRFASASLYKLFVMDAAEAAIEDGSLDPAETLSATPALIAQDPYADLQVGTRISVDCALRTMVEMSGNSAANLLLRRLSLASVAARMRRLGLKNSSITDTDAFTSPGDVGMLLESIARGQDVSAPASQRMLGLLGAQQHNDRVPAPLPLTVRVAHKTGELPGLRHDAAIVFAPSAAYLLVVMVEDAADESEARAAIVDISQSAYAALEPGGVATYRGLPPRLAQQVFRVPDGHRRMPLLGDPRTETAPLPADIDTVSSPSDPVSSPSDTVSSPSEPLRARPELVADLRALQQAANRAGTPFWVSSAFRQPTDAQAASAVPTEWNLPCEVEQPDRVADRPVRAADREAAQPRQVWLGTVLSLSDTPSRTGTAAHDADTPSPSASTATGGSSSDADTPVGKWLLAHAAEYGFVPALPESDAAAALGREPWTWRWVGRDMAARLRPLVGLPDYADRALAELGRAETELAAMDPTATRPAAWGLADACWTIATTSTRGCPSRWYFLGLPLH